jgi:hypothetical protein
VPAKLEFDEAYRVRPSQLTSVAQNRSNGLRYGVLGTARAASGAMRRLRATRSVTTIPTAITNVLVLIPSAVATRSPFRGGPQFQNWPLIPIWRDQSRRRFREQGVAYQNLHSS